MGSFNNVTYNNIRIHNNDTISNADVLAIYSFIGLDNTRKITFTDSNVKSICTANWGSNSEITYEQAALVKTIGNIFQGNTEITSFNELQYFIGLTSWTTDYNGKFAGCGNLTSISLPRAFATIIPSRCFVDCNKLASVTIPEGYTKIDGHAFDSCIIASLTIPSTIVTIGDSILQNNLANIKVKVLPVTPPTLAVASLGYIANGYSIYVPDASLSAYKSATNWRNMASNIYGLSSYPN